MKPNLYIRFSIRNDIGERNGGFVVLPLQGAWQEGDNDLHVAFAYEGAEEDTWYRPAVDKLTGDYLLPVPPWANDDQIVRRESPQTKATTKCVLAYCIDWYGKLPELYGRGWIGEPDYIKQVEGFWYSPNI